MTIKINTKHMPVGIWTPWADVVCPVCHHKHLGTSSAYTVEYDTLGKAEYGHTYCDECGCSILVDRNVAAEHNMVKMLNEHFGLPAEMWQTGGMCSACALPDPNPSEDDDNTLLITYGMTEDGVWDVGDMYDVIFSSTDMLEALAKAAALYYLRVLNV